MKILIGCEFSGVVRRAFRKMGHDAWSCDILPAEDSQRYHIKKDVLTVIGAGWDLAVFHPPCTHLAVSGARHFERKRNHRDEGELFGRDLVEEAAAFFMSLANAPIPMIAVENPVCIMSSLWRKPDQVIQPWQFGHGETKATCLWLKNLPKLEPTNIVSGREPRVHKLPPTKDRWKLRSITYQGIADAMANQWGNLLVDS